MCFCVGTETESVPIRSMESYSCSFLLHVALASCPVNVISLGSSPYPLSCPNSRSQCALVPRGKSAAAVSVPFVRWVVFAVMSSGVSGSRCGVRSGVAVARACTFILEAASTGSHRSRGFSYYVEVLSFFDLFWCLALYLNSVFVLEYWFWVQQKTKL